MGFACDSASLCSISDIDMSLLFVANERTTCRLKAVSYFFTALYASYCELKRALRPKALAMAAWRTARKGTKPFRSLHYRLILMKLPGVDVLGYDEPVVRRGDLLPRGDELADLFLA